MIEYVFEPEVRKMLVNFFAISGLRVGIHDADMNILLEYPVKSSEYGELRFCDRVRFYSPQFTQKCRDCDKRAFEHMRTTKKAYIYKCHAGFMEALIPVLAGGELICALMIGQVNQNGFDEDQFRKIVGHIDSAKLDETLTADLCDAYTVMPRLDERLFGALTYFLEMCAQSIYDNRWIRCAEKSIIENFIAFIEKNLYNNIDVRQTAAALYVSVSHLSRLIAAELGTTFTSYLAMQRIEAAKKLLATTNISVGDLASHLCFSEPGYFMKTFKRFTGMTCTEFRHSGMEYNGAGCL